MLLSWIAQYGFPIVVSVFLLKILTEKIERLSEAILMLSNDLKDALMQLGTMINENTKVLYELKGMLDRQRRGDKYE